MFAFSRGHEGPKDEPAGGHIVDPGVDGLHGIAQIGLAKLVLLGPAHRDIAQALLHDGVHPRQQEVDARALRGGLGNGVREAGGER